MSKGFGATLRAAFSRSLELGLETDEQAFAYVTTSQGIPPSKNNCRL
jgi:hypothetical protein